MLGKVNSFLLTKTDNVFLLNIDQSEKIIDSYKQKLANKDNYLLRSYYQYQCQKKIHGKLKYLTLDIISFLIIIPCVIFFLLKSFKVKKNSKITKTAVSTALSESIIPISLSKEFLIVNIKKLNYCLELTDISFILYILFKFPLNYYFILKNVIKIAQYRYFIRKYNCVAIIVTSEYSFTSSLMTEYCKKNNIKHINIMHGEKLFYIRDSFFSFDKCYVWDIHYIQIFQNLGAATGQFIIEQPPFFSDLKKFSSEVGHYFKYYLDGTETISEIIKIRDIIKPKFNDLIFRAHPLYTDLKMLDKYGICYENPNLMNITDSIKACEYVCSKYSTVLFQASLMNRKIVIDNLIDPELFECLTKMDYIICSKFHFLLSELININD